MARIKILKAPKSKKLSKFINGGEECPEGQIQDQFGNCVPDPEQIQSQQKMGTRTGVSDVAPQPQYQQTQMLTVNPNKAFAPMQASVPSIQMPKSNAFDIWSNPTDINGVEKNAMNMPKQTIVDANGNTTTKGVVDIGNETMYEAQKTPTGPAKNKKTKSNFWSGLHKLNQGIDNTFTVAGVALNYFDQQKKQKEFDKWMAQSMQPHNYYAVDTNQDRGDYDVNDGMFRPNQMGYKSKGTQANPYYAQQNFVEYGGSMPYAAEGMLVAGDRMAREAFIPDLAPVSFAMPQSIEAPAPTAPAATSGMKISSGTRAKGTDVATKTNNPGNMKFHPWMKRFGAESSGIPGQDGGVFAAFPDLESGLKAYQTQLFGDTDGVFKSSYYKPNTPVDKALRTWSNNGYGANIYPEIGHKTLGQLTQQERNELAKRQIKMESGSMFKQLKKAGIFAEQGGEISNNEAMKIRITGTPEMAAGGQAPYSGQSDYGLYIGQRNLYKTMAKHPYEDASRTVTEDENSESPYVLEAEGGETILRPDGTHMNITGRRHSEGGEKLNAEQAPEGSFIFSDTKKMKIKDPEVLKKFSKGSTKGGLTPATIAKQYDVNKYMGILQDPNTDPMAKKTAKLMIENYQKKLAELALVQEEMKGFPQGIPDVAKKAMGANQPPAAAFGGYIPHAAYGMNLPTEAMESLDIDPLLTTGTGYTPTGKSNKYNRPASYLEGWERLIPGVSKMSNEQAQNAMYTYMLQNNPDAISQMWTEYGLTNKGLKNKKGKYQNINNEILGLTKINPKTGLSTGKFKKGTKFTPEQLKALQTSYADNLFGRRQLDPKGKLTIIPPPVQEEGETGERYICSNGSVSMIAPGAAVPPMAQVYSSQAAAEAACSAKPGEIPPKDIPVEKGTTPTVPEGEPSGRVPKKGWTSQDIRNLGNAGIDYATLKKYHGYAPTMQPVLPEFIPQDWRGFAATQQANANAQAQQLGTYQPGQSMASNLSFLAGQQAGALGDYISKVDQYNASGASANDAQRAGILNQTTAANMAARKGLWDEENVYDDRYRTAERLARKGVVKAYDAGEDTASKIYNTNLTEKYYQIDPYTQQMVFNPQGGKAAWEASMQGGPEPGYGAKMAAQYKEIYDALGFLDPKERAARADSLLNGTASQGRVSKKTYPYNTAKNSVTETEPTDNRVG